MVFGKKGSKENQDVPNIPTLGCEISLHSDDTIERNTDHDYTESTKQTITSAKFQYNNRDIRRRFNLIN